MTDKFKQEPPKANMAEAASNLAQAWMGMAVEAAHIAHAKRTIFNAYLAEGFTESQALELIKAP